MFTQCSKLILQTGIKALSFPGSFASTFTEVLSDRRPSAAQSGAFSMPGKPVGFTRNKGACKRRRAASPLPFGTFVPLHRNPGHLPEAVMMAG